MNDQRFRGLFWRDPDRRVPGHFTWASDGTLMLELTGTLSPSAEPLSQVGELERVDGEIAQSQFAGPAISLFGCLQTHWSFGVGGSTEQWIAHRALVGADLPDENPCFPRVTLTGHGLKAFLGRLPALVEIEKRTADFSAPLIEAARGRVDEWDVLFGWRTTGNWSANHLELERVPVIEVVLPQPAPLEDILQDVLKPFELLLTIACRRHAAINTIRVGSSSARSESFDVLYPRVATEEVQKEPHRFDLLFGLSDFPDLGQLLVRLRRLLNDRPEFCAVFLGHERAPSRFVEDRVRGSLLSFGLLGLGEEDVVRAARASFEQARTTVSDPFALSSVGTAAIAPLARKLLTAPVSQALRIDPEAFMSQLVRAHRWTMFRDGEPCDVEGLLKTRDEVRQLSFLALLLHLGFDQSEAASRIAKAATRRL